MRLTMSIAFFFIIIVLKVPCLAQTGENEVDWGIHPMDYSDVGTCGWQFLKLPTNARTAAMGGIGSSISHGDANSALTNPASTADVSNLDFSFTHMNWVADISYQSIAVVKNLRNLGVLGINAIYVDYGEEMRTEYSEELYPGEVVYRPLLNQGTIGASDLAIGLSYARQITDKLQVGGNLKYLEERIDDAKANTWSLDIGTLFYTGFKTLRVSTVGRSFGPDAEFGGYKDRIEKVSFRVKMPMSLSIGTAIDVVEEKPESPSRIILAMEYVVPNDGPKKVNVGMEYEFMNILSLRAGYKFNYDEVGLTLGGGLNHKMRGMTLNIDYAYLDMGLFKQVHMFSLGMHM